MDWYGEYLESGMGFDDTEFDPFDEYWALESVNRDDFKLDLLMAHLCAPLDGGIVDTAYNEKVAKLLEDLMGRKNVRLLAGNHEYIGLRVLGKLCKKGGLAAPFSAQVVLADGTIKVVEPDGDTKFSGTAITDGTTGTKLSDASDTQLTALVGTSGITGAAYKYTESGGEIKLTSAALTTVAISEQTGQANQWRYSVEKNNAVLYLAKDKSTDSGSTWAGSADKAGDDGVITITVTNDGYETLTATKDVTVRRCLKNGNMHSGEGFFCQTNTIFRRNNWMYFKKNWDSMAEKDPPLKGVVLRIHVGAAISRPRAHIMRPNKRFSYLNAPWAY
ncbi:hypothetical protein [Colidextribacter sp. OB.20]|uniref:hypothetical protein n=1 Tax=Colidextribacter sp. OB.20 TaxID=2304568 RepID=UPI001370B0A7|nr:hypothetical protein [Colidextribacter sp. OB.20]